MEGWCWEVLWVSHPRHSQACGFTPSLRVAVESRDKWCAVLSTLMWRGQWSFFKRDETFKASEFGHEKPPPISYLLCFWDKSLLYHRVASFLPQFQQVQGLQMCTTTPGSWSIVLRMESYYFIFKAGIWLFLRMILNLRAHRIPLVLVSAVAEFTGVCHMPGLVVSTLKNVGRWGNCFQLDQNWLHYFIEVGRDQFYVFPQTGSYYVFLGGLELIM